MCVMGSLKHEDWQLFLNNFTLILKFCAILWCFRISFLEIDIWPYQYLLLVMNTPKTVLQNKGDDKHGKGLWLPQAL